MPGFEAFAWFGLVAPAKTPGAVLEKLQSDVVSILASADTKARLTELGAAPGTVSGAAFGKFLTEDTAKWSELIRISGAKME